MHQSFPKASSNPATNGILGVSKGLVNRHFQVRPANFLDPACGLPDRLVS
jgi:hypothetical protein